MTFYYRTLAGVNDAFINEPSILYLRNFCYKTRSLQILSRLEHHKLFLYVIVKVLREINHCIFSLHYTCFCIITFNFPLPTCEYILHGNNKILRGQFFFIHTKFGILSYFFIEFIKKIYQYIFKTI